MATEEQDSRLSWRPLSFRPPAVAVENLSRMIKVSNFDQIATG
jgi:hypothetical protein